MVSIYMVFFFVLGDGGSAFFVDTVDFKGFSWRGHLVYLDACSQNRLARVGKLIAYSRPKTSMFPFLLYTFESFFHWNSKSLEGKIISWSLCTQKNGTVGRLFKLWFQGGKNPLYTSQSWSPSTKISSNDSRIEALKRGITGYEIISNNPTWNPKCWGF